MTNSRSDKPEVEEQNDETVMDNVEDLSRAIDDDDVLDELVSSIETGRATNNRICFNCGLN